VTPNAILTVKDLNRFPYLRALDFPQVQRATVTLLIDTDVPDLFCTCSMRKDAQGQPIAVQTPLDWSFAFFLCLEELLCEFCEV